jgi:hypothetical protein
MSGTLILPSLVLLAIGAGYLTLRDRARLSAFHRACRAHFGFLVSEYGFAERVFHQRSLEHYLKALFARTGPHVAYLSPFLAIHIAVAPQPRRVLVELEEIWRPGAQRNAIDLEGLLAVRSPDAYAVRVKPV